VRIGRGMPVGVECPAEGDRDALVYGEGNLASRGDAGRHVQNQRIVLQRRHRDGERAVVHARGTRAVRGHIGRVADQSHACHVLGGGQKGVVAHGSLVRRIADQAPADAYRTCLVDDLPHGELGNDRPEGVIALNEHGGGRLALDAHLRARVHAAGPDALQIGRDAQHAMGVDTAQIRPHEHFGLGRGVLPGQPRAGKDLRGELLQNRRADAHILRHGPSCSFLQAIPRQDHLLRRGSGFCRWASSMTAICWRTCAGVTTSGAPLVSAS